MLNEFLLVFVLQVFFWRHLLTTRFDFVCSEDKHAADIFHNLPFDLNIFPSRFISLLRPFFHIFLRFSDLTEHVSQDLKYLVELEFVQTLTYCYHRCFGIQVPCLYFFSRFVHHIIQQFLECDVTNSSAVKNTAYLMSFVPELRQDRCPFLLPTVLHVSRDVLSHCLDASSRNAFREREFALNVFQSRVFFSPTYVKELL